MKQAFTNTIRGGNRNPLTIAPGSKKGRNSKQQLPKCAYGAACTRKGCAYRHPPPSDAPYESYHEDPRSKICKPFLAGLCTYGHKCLNRHPSQDEANAVRATYKEKSCSYGDDCQTEGCLYWHPWEAREAIQNGDFAGEICTAVGGLHLEAGVTDGGAIPTYEQWLALNCPPPPTMDETYVYNIWHYPGSGMQRSPWEVYCLMYGQDYNNTMNGASLSATSQTWDPAVNNHIHAPPQSWEPANHSVNTQQAEEPKTFQEWKKKGQPYPSWFSSDIDPWYDDEGVRRSLEEVYEVLYGENAQEKFAQKQQAQSVANDPTPAELAAMISTNDPSLHGSSPPVLQNSTMGGWASIAAKRPVPVQKPGFPTANNDTSTITGNQSAGGESAGNLDQKRKLVIIPKEVWLPSTANSDCFHLYPNPIERFNAVNQHHKSYLASVSIPKCFEDAAPNPNKAKIAGKVALLDVHFQSGKTITPVLNRFLTPALKKNDEVWVVTGSGNHVAVGHQRREGGGVLFNAVLRYLEEREAEMTLEFRIGKDTSGGKNKSSGGAFLVRKLL
eukprot:CAMPEP_0183736164 /NCGR_PEP_ID=MMETSP0737-20130205/48635_1 /TAXON_ID=385413 /ORGANISM="Thalassiosira miniscula, Strain CCMP1093" /LENGTH=555 /DNA_ID=CAMNT_0025970101 /DNA_START=144 /DNA_END=1811 /DNA_ORIENTATION=+